jgi:UDP-glucuronate decarboxylase
VLLLSNIISPLQDFAYIIKDITNSNSTIKFLPATTDDPRQRKPDITTAKERIGWSPEVPVRVGLTKAVAYFRKELESSGEIIPTGPDASRPNKPQ